MNFFVTHARIAVHMGCEILAFLAFLNMRIKYLFRYSTQSMCVVAYS